MGEEEKKVFLGADHAGFALKERIRSFLELKGVEYQDLGAKKLDQNDDYPDYAFKVSEKVAKTNNSMGILVCGSAAGMCIAANKVKGIRAVAANEPRIAALSRSHNDTNVLCLKGWDQNFELTKDIISSWLDTQFSGEERHVRRLKKIADYEKSNYR